jgi:hypothetical protein
MLTSAVASAVLGKTYITIPALSIYYLLFITKFHVLHGTLLGFKNSLISTFAKYFISLAIIEVLLELYQFANQRSFGLQMLGESVISPYFPGVAKVEALGQIFVRGYGTFPHPNILGAFLVIAIVFAIFTLKSETARNRMSKIAIVTTLLLGLFITFSRAGWLAGGAVLVIYGCAVLAQGIGKIRKSTIFEIAAYICAIIVMVFIFLPFVYQRGNVFDKAYTERISYNYAGISIMRNHPIFGIGPSESMIHMEQLLAKNTLPSEIQPIHNYFIITAAEIGTVGAAAFLLFCLWQLWVVGINLLYKRNMIEEAKLAAYVALLSCVILMFFDHYYYTFQPAGLLLWLIIGLVAQETFSPKNTKV